MTIDKNSDINLPVLKIGKHTPKYPVIQGGMGIRVSAHKLAGAVAKAGGVGTIASVALGLDSKHFTGKNYFDANRLALTDEIHWARETAPDGIIAVNSLVALTDYEQMVRTTAEAGANVVISGAGLPLQLPEFTADFPDVALVPIVSSVKAASLIIRKWEKSCHRLPDAIIVEAPSTAGGHLGAKYDEVYSPDLTLEKVIPELVEFLEKEIKVDIPVIGAGGVWDREDMLKVFALGARGVQMGTRFVCTEECDAPASFKQMYIDSTPDDVTLVKSPVGLPGRAILNKFAKKLEEGAEFHNTCLATCLKHCSYKVDKKGFCICTALSKAHKGNVDDGLVFCGSNAPRSTEISTVDAIFRDLFPE